MTLNTEKKRKCVTRINKMRGQLKGLERVILEDRGCVDIFQQAMAIKGAANALMAAILKEHIESHILDASTKAQREKEVSELLSILKSYFKQS